MKMKDSFFFSGRERLAPLTRLLRHRYGQVPFMKQSPISNIALISFHMILADTNAPTRSYFLKDLSHDEPFSLSTWDHPLYSNFVDQLSSQLPRG